MWAARTMAALAVVLALVEVAKAAGCDDCRDGTCPRDCTIPGDLGITENDVAIFHISLWSSVFLVLATCYAGCALSYMDTGDDSIFNIDISAGVKKGQ